MVCNMFAQIRDRFATDSRKFSTRFAHIRDRFAKVIDGYATDSQLYGKVTLTVCEVHTRYSRQIRGFSMDSRIRDGVRRFAQIRDRFAKVLDTIRADSRQIRDRFADSHARFAQVRKDSRWILHGSPCKMFVKSPSRPP